MAEDMVQTKKAIKPTKVLPAGHDGLPKRLQKIYAKNAQKSRLLDLPPELRTRVWSFVLCGHTIHLPGYQNGPRHQICKCDTPDSELLERLRAQIHVKDLYPERDLYAKCHADCTPGRGAHYDSGRRLSTAILQVCRQIHEEAALLPFHGNIFAAASLTSLASFAQHLLMEQARAIVEIVIYTHETYDPNTKTMAKTLVTRLRGVEKLTIFKPARDAYRYSSLSGVDMVMERQHLANCLKEIQIADVKIVAYDVDYRRRGVRDWGMSMLELREWEAGVEKAFHDACYWGEDA
ncbi:hypothetical protein LTR78_001175 [Recurvomyces mirabilis]|uniref:DUF7730 domain-containing protein n=1 Tax=Recurvomyces mirabilis TaxID=574656 RepID=A0AAE1C5F8_9PEZI|nr:hypothetical protein LTR78_001175 [Recurvomyces mirabilis]KAK5161151.1 hypothetical protein LTS14_000947 [Recurvomyces mirabilis]